MKFFIYLFLGFGILSNWYLYESKTYGFKIEFPKKPIISTEEVITELGKLKLNYIVYDCSLDENRDGNLTYLVNCIEYPIDKVNSSNEKELVSIYNKSINTSLQSIKGKLIQEKVIFVKEFKGRDIIIDVPSDNYRIKMRLVLVKNKMYMIQVFSEKTKNLTNESLNKFIKSFDIIY